MKNNTLAEAAAIAYFVNTVAEIEPGSLIGENEVAAIRAAVARIRRQIEGASKAGSARSRKKTRAARAAIKARWAKRDAESE